MLEDEFESEVEGANRNKTGVQDYDLPSPRLTRQAIASTSIRNIASDS